MKVGSDSLEAKASSPPTRRGDHGSGGAETSRVVILCGHQGVEETRRGNGTREGKTHQKTWYEYLQELESKGKEEDEEESNTRPAWLKPTT